MKRPLPLLPVWAGLLLATGSGALGAEEADATPPAADPGTEAAAEGDSAGQAASGENAFWDQFANDKSVEIAREHAEAEGYFLQARSLLQRGRFIEAKEAVDRAIAIFPFHKGAQKLRQDINGILGKRHDRLGMVADWLAAIGAVAEQQKAIEMHNLLEKGDKYYNANDFEDAFLAYDRVIIGIRTSPYQFDWGDLPEQVEAKKLQAATKAREQALAQDKIERRKAERESAIRSRMEQEILVQQVDTILARAKAAFERKLYPRAAEEAFNAYELDRTREDARELYLEARRLSHVQFDDLYREERLERLARVNEQIHIDMIPQSDLLVFPSDWFRRDLRTAESLTETEAEAWRVEIENRFAQEVSFVWDENSLEEVIDFLRRTTGVNYVVQPEALVDPSIPPITLRGTMKLGTILDWIVELTDLQMAIRNEAVYFSTERIQGDMVVRMYNVTDLITPVTNFPGPDLAYNAASGGTGGFDLFGGGGGGGFGGGFGGDDEEGSISPDELQEMIQTNVQPESWETGVITYRDGSKTLFVTQTPEVHEEVEALLRHLRNQASLEVNVRIRVLDVLKSFIEEIGVEWNDVRPQDVLSNRLGSFGYFDVNREWSFEGSTRNVLPPNQYTNGFADNFGKGLRFNFISSNNASTLFDLRTVNAVLEAMESESDTQVLAAPELTCFDGQRANATFIDQYAYISDYDVGGEDNYDPVIDVINFGDIIDIKPLVSADRKYITLEVRPSSVLLNDVFVETIETTRETNDILIFSDFPIEMPNVEVRTMRSTVTLPDKGSLMLGGYVAGLRQRTHSGIPFLSHIPFLGRLFSKEGIYDENRHLFFLISAEIVDLQEYEAQQ